MSEESEFDSRLEHQILLFATVGLSGAQSASYSVVTEEAFPGGRGCQTDHTPLPSDDELYLHSPICLHGVVHMGITIFIQNTTLKVQSLYHL
jgi:hypothetical protein